MGNVQFHDSKVLFTPGNKVAMHGDCCCDAFDCSNGCDPGGVPEEVTVEISGFTADCANGPGSCSCLNDTYILAYPPSEYCNFGYLDVVYCAWRYTIPGGCCIDSGLICLAVGLVLGTPNQYALLVSIGTGVGAPIYYRNLLGTSKPDCNSWNQEVVAYLQGGSDCDGSEGTVKVTF